jgi:hypothetical protein
LAGKLNIAKAIAKNKVAVRKIQSLNEEKMCKV